MSWNVTGSISANSKISADKYCEIWKCQRAKISLEPKWLLRGDFTERRSREVCCEDFFFFFFFFIRSVHTKFTFRHYVFYYMCKTFCLHKYIYSSTILVFLSIFPPYRRILLTVLILLYFPS